MSEHDSADARGVRQRLSVRRIFRAWWPFDLCSDGLNHEWHEVYGVGLECSRCGHVIASAEGDAP